jgi:hypothetical protein
MPNHRPARRLAGIFAFVYPARPAPAPEVSWPPSHLPVHVSSRLPSHVLPRMRSRWLEAVATMLGVALALGAFGIGGAQWSAAQRRDLPRIFVAPTIVAEPASQAPFVIQVGPPDALPSNSFLRLRGFPASVSLTEGHAIAPGSWAIPLFGLPSLKAIVPAGVSGRNEISITLVGVDGTTLAESSTALVIAAQPPPEKAQPAPPQRQAVPAVAPPPVRIPPPGPDLAAEDKVRAERMLAQGAKHLEQGNIGAARMFFLRAAEAGLAAGALRMGATYDPQELGRLESLGVNADRNEARKWYEMARDLGAPEATDRLGRLR